VWPRDTVRLKSCDEYHDSLCLESMGLAWIDEARTLIVHPIQRDTRVYTPDVSLPTRDASVER